MVSTKSASVPPALLAEVAAVQKNEKRYKVRNRTVEIGVSS